MPSKAIADKTPVRANHLLSLLAAVGVGATVMYFLDPARGTRRRHLVRDKLVHGAHVATDTAGATARDLANRARGLGAVARRRFGDDADDVVLAERVRAELGRAVSHPGAIEVTVEQSTATLTGRILSNEADRLISRVGSVRGIKGVEDHLERREHAGRISDLQGGTQASRESSMRLS